MLLDDIAYYIEQQGRGTVGTDIFVSQLRDEPDNCTILYDTGGVEPDHYLPNANPTFQVYVRNADYATGKTLIDNIVEDFEMLANETLKTGGKYFYYILVMGEAAHIGRDKSGRDEFTVNFRTKIRR